MSYLGARVKPEASADHNPAMATRREIINQTTMNTADAYKPKGPTPEQQAQLDPSSPTYAGPGYKWDPNTGGLTIPADQTDENALYWQLQKTKAPDAPDLPSYFDVVPPPTPAQATATSTAPVNTRLAYDPVSTAALDRYAPRATTAIPRAVQGMPDVDLSGIDPNLFRVPDGTGDGDPYTAPGAEAPKANRANIDPLLLGVNATQQKLLALAETDNRLSAAEAALQKASREADIRSALSVEQSQRAALGAARSGRNRGDRALLERQALGEAAFIGQEGARTDVLRQAEQEGNLAILRANEEDANRRFKADILGKAADLGLNTAALEFDISSVDLQSATNWLNNEFQQLGLDKQLSAQESERILDFTVAMAGIQFQYDALSVEDQNEADRLIMQKYGIDQGTMIALKQIKQQGKTDWMGVLGALGGATIGGIATFATAGAAAPAIPALAGAGAQASDVRVKENIRPIDKTDDAQFEELMGALSANAYDYRDPGKHGLGRRFGFMAQELEETELGAHMVKPDEDGTKTVDIAPLAMATASGLALVFKRLKELESSV